MAGTAISVLGQFGAKSKNLFSIGCSCHKTLLLRNWESWEGVEFFVAKIPFHCSSEDSDADISDYIDAFQTQRNTFQRYPLPQEFAEEEREDKRWGTLLHQLWLDHLTRWKRKEGGGGNVKIGVTVQSWGL